MLIGCDCKTYGSGEAIDNGEDYVVLLGFRAAIGFFGV